MRIFTEEQMKQMESKKRWVAWLSAYCARNYEWYVVAKRVPGFYKEGAEKDFAAMSLEKFKELCATDKSAAKMIWESMECEFAEMIKELNGDYMEYLRLMN